MNKRLLKIYLDRDREYSRRRRRRGGDLERSSSLDERDGKLNERSRRRRRGSSSLARRCPRFLSSSLS